MSKQSIDVELSDISQANDGLVKDKHGIWMLSMSVEK